MTHGLFERGARGLEKMRQGQIVVDGARLLIEELRHLQHEAEAAGHPLARSRRVSWDRLLAQPWGLTRKPSLARIFIEECFLRYGHPRIRRLARAVFGR